MDVAKDDGNPDEDKAIQVSYCPDAMMIARRKS